MQRVFAVVGRAYRLFCSRDRLVVLCSSCNFCSKLAFFGFMRQTASSASATSSHALIVIKSSNVAGFPILTSFQQSLKSGCQRTLHGWHPNRLVFIPRETSRVRRTGSCIDGPCAHACHFRSACNASDDALCSGCASSQSVY